MKRKFNPVSPAEAKRREEENKRRQPRKSSVQRAPSDVIWNIFSRVPLKAVIWGKKVCPEWNALLSHPDFSERYRSETAGILTITGDFDVALMGWIEVVDSTHPDVNTELKSVNLLHLHRFHPFRDLDPPYPVSSVNGLVCLFQLHDSRYEIFILNPFIKQVFTLPQPESPRCTEVSFGFAINTVNDEMKIIRISDGTHRRYTDVYTLGSGTWRSLPDAPYNITERIGTNLKNRVYWLTTVDNGSVICSFDLDTEAFQQIATSEQLIISMRDHVPSLGVLEDSLCVGIGSFGFTNFWCIGDDQTWSIKLECGMTPFQFDRRMHGNETHNSVVIKSLNDGSHLIIYESLRLLRYQSKRYETKMMYSDDMFWRGVCYRPSLFSIHNKFEQERGNLHRLREIVE